MKRTMHRTIDKMARLARSDGPIDIVDTCERLDIAPSTFYNYTKFVTRRYQDIIYEDGYLKAIKTESVDLAKVHKSAT